MPRRIDKLTSEQEAMMEPWADKWIEVGLRTGPSDHAAFEAAAERCYEAAGVPWHGRVAWVGSPMTMALAAPIAAHIIGNLRAKPGVILTKPGADGEALAAVRNNVDEAVSDVRTGPGRSDDQEMRYVVAAEVEAVGAHVYDAVDSSIAVLVGAKPGVRDEVLISFRDDAHTTVFGGVASSLTFDHDAAKEVSDAVAAEVGGVEAPVRDSIENVILHAVRGTVDDVIDGVIDDVGVPGAVRNAVSDLDTKVGAATRGISAGMVRNAVAAAVENAISRFVSEHDLSRLKKNLGGGGGVVAHAVRDAVEDALGPPIAPPLVERRRAVASAISDAVRVAVADRMEEALGQEVVAPHESELATDSDYIEDDVRDAIREVIRNAADGDLAQSIRDLWYRYIGGQFWVGGWHWYGSPSVASFFREVCHLELDGDLWERAIAYQTTAENASWWWPHADFIIAVEHPSAIHREPIDHARLRGAWSHRLHNDDGPAIAWPDGWGVYAVHGVRVPGWIIEHPERITWASIVEEENTEIRRVMLVRAGDGVLSSAEMRQADDFGALYAFPPLPGMDEDVMMVRLTCPSTGRIYLERVPPTMRSARAAVAWQFGMSEDEYAPAVQS